MGFLDGRFRLTANHRESTTIEFLDTTGYNPRLKDEAEVTREELLSAVTTSYLESRQFNGVGVPTEAQPDFIVE